MNPNRIFTTLDEFSVTQTRLFKNSTGNLSTILRGLPADYSRLETRLPRHTYTFLDNVFLWFRCLQTTLPCSLSVRQNPCKSDLHSTFCILE